MATSTERVRDWRAANREHVLAYARAYRKAHREAMREAQARWRAAHPDTNQVRHAQYDAAVIAEKGPRYQRKRARVTLQAAVRRGQIVRQPCEVCGATPVEGHHTDYNQPLEVRWLCRRHHEEAHHSCE